ncbi:MAG: phospholipid carrier-dependent glycosyltransferase [Xanthomonadales bacterium]|nr:phospholipid carrier-dependent glycosyltransferase [Xanthomonadales bacterium]
MFELPGLIITQYTWLAVWLSSALVTGLALQSVLLDFSQPRSQPQAQVQSPWPNAELAVFFGISGGLAVQILLLIALAVSGQLNPVAIGLSSALLLGASAWFLWQQPACLAALRSNFDLPFWEWLAILPILLIIGAWLVRPLGPAAGSDSLTYHLPYARFYLEQGGLTLNDTLRYPLHTHNINLLYAVALLKPGPALAQMLHASLGWLSLLGIYGAARAWRGWPTAIAGVVAVLLLDEFVYSFSAAFVDNGLMLFTTAAFLAMTRWQEGQGQEGHDRGWLWFAAICAGTAMGTKYLGAWFTVPLGLWVLWQSRSLNLSVRFALLVSAVGLFWYLRSWWLVGNPVHPFAGDLFGYSIWSASDLQGQMTELASHGLDKTWLNLLLLPFKMFSEWHRFNGSVGNAGFLIGLFMASCVLLPWQKPVLKPVHLICLAYLLFWFWTSQVIRYLMIILPLMSLCTMVLWAECISRLPRLYVRLGSSSLVLALLILSGLSAQRIYRDMQWIPLTPQGQHKALLNSQPAYAVAIAAMADERIADGPILQFQVQEIRWFFPGAVYGDWMGRYPFQQFAHIGPSDHWEINAGDVLIEQVKSIGAVAVVFRKETDQFSPQPLESYLNDFEIIEENEATVLMVPR